jgi:hypothetical protein
MALVPLEPPPSASALVPDTSSTQLITEKDASASKRPPPKFGMHQQSQDTSWLVASLLPFTLFVIVVLDEEEYSATLEKIITRDFFPALPHLQRQLGVASALDPGTSAPTPSASATATRQDVAAPTPTPTRGAQARAQAAEAWLAAQRGGGAGAGAGAGQVVSSSSFEDETPLHPSAGRSSSASSSSSAAASASSSSSASKPATKKLRKEDLRLNAFLLTHTSEDNAAFDVLHQRDLAAHRERYSWLQQQKDGHALLLLESTQPDNERRQLGTWTYTQRNALMFSAPDPSPEAVRERQAMAVASVAAARGAPPAVSYENTRFPGALFEAPKPRVRPSVRLCSALFCSVL